MDWKSVNTQLEFDAAVKAGFGVEVCAGEFAAWDSAQVRASGSAQVTAWDSAQVTAWDSAQVRASGSAQVTAWDSARVTAWDSAQVRASGSAQVTAWGSAQVRASGSAQVRASDSAQVRAGKYNAVTFSAGVKVTGGVKIKLPAITTLAAWASFHAARVVRGVVTVYKAVGDDYRSPKGGDYTPGRTEAAADWDGGKAECGGGLHFSPTPHHALGFNAEARRFVECRVRVADCRKPRAEDSYPQKIKARSCKCIREVDIDGKPVKGADHA